MSSPTWEPPSQATCMYGSLAFVGSVREFFRKEALQLQLHLADFLRGSLEISRMFSCGL